MLSFWMFSNMHRIQISTTQIKISMSEEYVNIKKVTFVPKYVFSVET